MNKTRFSSGLAKGVRSSSSSKMEEGLESFSFGSPSKKASRKPLKKPPRKKIVKENPEGGGPVTLSESSQKKVRDIPAEDKEPVTLRPFTMDFGDIRNPLRKK